MAVAVPEEKPEGFLAPALIQLAVDDGLDPLCAEVGVVPPLRTELAAEIESAYTAEAETAQQALERRQADERLVDYLAGEKFTGPAYEAFADDLARYATSVLRAWISSGQVFALLRKRGIGQELSDREREAARRTDLVDDLAGMTVAKSLAKFRRDALVGQGWLADRGASVATYFMGQCLYIFLDELRAHRRAEARWAANVPLDALPDELEYSSTDDPAQIVGHVEASRDLLRSFAEREVAIVVLKSEGYTQQEIRELLDEPSVRAIEAVLYRLRGKGKHRE